jgi:hypothetical protein
MGVLSSLMIEQSMSSRVRLDHASSNSSSVRYTYRSTSIDAHRASESDQVVELPPTIPQACRCESPLSLRRTCRHFELSSSRMTQSGTGRSWQRQSETTGSSLEWPRKLA